MDLVIVFFIVLAAIGVFLIAAGTIGREAHRLDAFSPRVVYEFAEAMDFVAERLPESTQARLTQDELHQLLLAHMQWLRARGLQPDRIMELRQEITDVVVVDETTAAAFLLGEAEKIGVTVLDDVDVVQVVDAHLEYFAAIGAVGPQTSL